MHKTSFEHVIDLLRDHAKTIVVVNSTGVSGVNGVTPHPPCLSPHPGHPKAPGSTGVTSANLLLSNFISRTTTATTLADLAAVLEEFAQHDWHITERSSLSAAYTPHALKLIESEGVNKVLALQDLFSLCWNKR